MELLVKRFEYKPEYTISRLYLDGKYECFILEDKVREDGSKVFGETAIPIGRYSLILDFSTRFKKTLPHILNVPGFEGIRIHSGNKAEDTEGCLLVGQGWLGGNTIINSKRAFSLLYSQLEKAFSNKENIFINIEDTV